MAQGIALNYMTNFNVETTQILVLFGADFPSHWRVTCSKWRKTM